MNFYEGVNEEKRTGILRNIWSFTLTSQRPQFALGNTCWKAPLVN